LLNASNRVLAGLAWMRANTVIVICLSLFLLCDEVPDQAGALPGGS